jgi:hypothetical protein
MLHGSRLIGDVAARVAIDAADCIAHENRYAVRLMTSMIRAVVNIAVQIECRHHPLPF